MRFRVSKIIYTDQEKHFNNNLVKNLCEQLNIYKAFSAAYYLKANRMVEQKNHIIVQMVRKVVQQDVKKWP